MLMCPLKSCRVVTVVADGVYKLFANHSVAGP